jgi:ABC-2 type transport system permease protein
MSTIAVAGEPRSLSRPASWLRAYWLSLRFDLSNQRTWLPLAVALQIILGAGMAMIYGFYVPRLPKVALVYLVTGAPTLALIPVGLVLLPTLVGMQKTAGIFDYLWSLPIPRPIGVASTLTVGSLVAIPGIVTTLVLAAWRYGVQLNISWMVVPAFLLCSLMCASVGLGFAHGIKNPVVVNLITNTLIFVVLLFSPISFPISQFPTWLADVHRVLPFYHMANVIRASLSTGLVNDLWVSYAVLAAWTLAGWAVTAWVVGRRG